MKKASKRSTLARALATIGAVMVVVTGVTFASLQSQQAVLKGNTIQTANANLQLSTDGTTYTNSLSGFVFGNLIPGGQPSPNNGYTVYLKNSGTTALSLTLSIAKPITNPDNVNLSKVHLQLTPIGAGQVQDFVFQDLLASASTGGLPLNNASRIIATQTIGYTLKVAMDADAISGPSGTLSDVDFSFGATAIN